MQNLRKRPQAPFRLELGKHLIDAYSYQKRAANQVPALAIQEEGRKKECVQCKSAGQKTPKGYPVEMRNKCQQ